MKLEYAYLANRITEISPVEIDLYGVRHSLQTPSVPVYWNGAQMLVRLTAEENDKPGEYELEMEHFANGKSVAVLQRLKQGWKGRNGDTDGITMLFDFQQLAFPEFEFNEFRFKVNGKPEGSRRIFVYRGELVGAPTIGLERQG